MKTLFIIFLVGFILIVGGLGILDLIFTLIGGLIGLIVGLFGVVVGLVGGMIGLVVGSLAVLFTLILPILIIGAIIGGILKLVF